MTDEVLTMREGRIGRIRLNRPKALNALNTEMCMAMSEALAEWRGDLAVEAVLLDHAEGRGFCAGGDIRMVAESGKADGKDARAFFSAEYTMNHQLFTYAKAAVAFMDGITMGGGVGISLPCKYRVSTERTKFAMPETGIGLFPDVGGGWYLSRLPGRMGQFLALTGHRLNGAECKALGLATHYLTSDTLDNTKESIADKPQAIGVILDSLEADPPEATIMAQSQEIDRLFASDRLEDIYSALEADGGAWATEQLAVLKTKSPQTMKVSLRLLMDGAKMRNFAHEMRQEYAVASRVVQRHDFIEGVRAVIVDKDNKPQWDPATPEDVTDHVIDQIFAPLPDDQVWRPA